jgi:hypothetical protein
MSLQKQNPRRLGVGLRKLAGWAQINATTIGNVLLLAVLLAAVVWQGGAR